MQWHKARVRFKKQRQRDNETIDKLLDDLEMMRRRNQPDESIIRMSLAVASKFIDGVKNDKLRTILATHYSPLSSNAPKAKKLRLKFNEYLLLKPPMRSSYYKNNYYVLTMDQQTRSTTGTGPGMKWTRDALSCTN